MRLVYIVIIIVMSCSHCLARNEPSYQEIDIEITNNLPFITIQIEDRPIKILLDTGARNQELVINKEIISTLKTLVKFPIKFKSNDITGKTYIANKYILPKFNIGKIEFLQTQIEEDTNWGLSSSSDKSLQKKDGVAGLALFKNKAIIIDYPKNKLIVMDRKYPLFYDINNWHDLKYKIDHYGLSIYAAIDSGKEKRFILDSGSNISLIKPNSIGNNKIMPNCQIILQPGVECAHIESKNFIINKTNYKNIYFYIYNFREPIADGILGYEFLADKVIYVDFDKRQMRIKSTASNK